MKLLLVVLGVIVAVNANSESIDSLANLDVGNLNEEFLNQAKILAEEVQKLQDDVKQAISEKLKQVPEVKKVLDQFTEALIQTSITGDCAASVDQHYAETLDSVTVGILQKTLKNITNSEDYLKNVQQQLVLLQSVAKQDPKEVDVDKFLNVSEQIYKFVDLTKAKVINHVQNEVASDDVKEEIEDFVANVPECLAKQSKPKA